MRIRPIGFVDSALLLFARKLARPICKKFKLSHKNLHLFEHDDPERVKSRGICWEDGKIELDFRSKNSKSFAKIETIIDTVVHELAHLRHMEHDKKFWDFFDKMHKWTYQNLVNPKE